MWKLPPVFSVKVLIHDNSAAASAIEQAVDERVAKAIIDLDDPEIVIVNNGRVKSSFEEFWAELQMKLLLQETWEHYVSSNCNFSTSFAWTSEQTSC